MVFPNTYLSYMIIGTTVNKKHGYPVDTLHEKIFGGCKFGKDDLEF